VKISFFKPNSLLEGGGAERWLIDISKAISKYSNVNIIGLSYLSKKRFSSSVINNLLTDVDYYEFPYIKFPRGVPFPKPNYVTELLELFNESDVIYIISSTPIEILFFILKSKITTPMILGFHGFPRSDILLQRMYTPLLKHFLNIFNGFHVLNFHTYSWIRERTKAKIYFIPNGVDISLFKLCKSPLNSNKFNILSTGRLDKDKGIDILLKIIIYFNSNNNYENIQFTITGSGPLENIVKKVSHRFKNVNYVGFVPSKIYPKIIRESNLFLAPSRTEGMPLRVLEAQSCGLPVIGSKIPGIYDIIINNETGSLIELGDIKDFTEEIKRYYNLWCQSKRKYYSLNKNIRKYTINTYNSNDMIIQLDKMFRSIS
jgi:glycosyltransferase involved in cell wall biosynthesis